MLRRVTVGVAIAMLLYHFVTVYRVFWGTFEHQALHLGFGLVLVFLSTLAAAKTRRMWVLNFTLILVSVAVIGYILGRFNYLLFSVGFIRSPVDAIIGILLTIVAIEATRQAWGWILPIVIITFIAYFFFGHLLPPPLEHSPMQPSFVLSMLGIGFHGIFGATLATSADFIFLFMVFGSLMGVTGGRGFFVEVGRAVGRLRIFAGGTAQATVVASALVGSVVGQPVSNVVICGSFTIPMMKKAGYSPEEAGAIESAASCGGSFLPPVMGVVAFVMAGFLGIAYVDIAYAALIPSILYYLLIGLAVEIMARKRGIMPLAETRVDTGEILRTGPLFFVPLITISAILVMRYSTTYAAFYGIAATVLTPFLFKRTRPRLGVLLAGFVDGAITGAKISVALGAIGMMIQSVITTGLGILIANVVNAVSGGHLWLALIVTMIVSLILGTGVPVLAAYLLVAVTVVPSLVEMGVSPLAAHFFNFWFATFSAITPPVAFTSMAAAAIAGGKFGRTSLEAIRLVIPSFLLPYLMVYGPPLLLRPSESLNLVTTVLAALFGLSVVTILFYRHFLVSLRPWETVLFVLAGAGLLSYFFAASVVLFGAGLSLFLALAVRQYRRAAVPKPAADMKPSVIE